MLWSPIEKFGEAGVESVFVYGSVRYDSKPNDLDLFFITRKEVESVPEGYKRRRVFGGGVELFRSEKEPSLRRMAWAHIDIGLVDKASLERIKTVSDLPLEARTMLCSNLLYGRPIFGENTLYEKSRKWREDWKDLFKIYLVDEGLTDIDGFSSLERYEAQKRLKRIAFMFTRWSLDDPNLHKANKIYKELKNMNESKHNYTRSSTRELGELARELVEIASDQFKLDGLDFV